MKRLLRNIHAAGLPGHGRAPLALIETIAGLVYGKDLPRGIAKSTREDRAIIREAISVLHDWRKEDFSILGFLYESLIDSDKTEVKSGRRRRSGIFYTPDYITRFLVKEAINACRSGDRGSPLRIIDPACGCGTFLVAGLRELIRKFPGIDRSVLATEYLHGVDSDADAVHVARLVIRMEAGLDGRGWRTLCRNIRHGDSLREFTRATHDRYDVVVGNPPYRNVKRGIDPATAEFCKLNFQTAKGQWDLAGPFVELTLKHLLTPGGACGLILPKPILLAENYEPVRQIILENNPLAFGPAGAPFADPGVEASLLIAGAGKGAGKKIIILDGSSAGTVRKVGNIPVSLLKRLANRNFSHLADGELLTPVLDGLENGKLIRLGDTIRLTRGIELGKRDGRIRMNDGSLKKGEWGLIAGESVSEFSVEVRYAMSVTSRDQDSGLFKDPAIWKTHRLLLIRRVAGEPVGAVYENCSKVRTVALNTIYVAQGRGEFDEYAVCALVNSWIFREIFRQMYAFDDVIFPYLRISQLNAMPVPPGALTDMKLSGWSKNLHLLPGNGKQHDTSSIGKLRDKIDRRCVELYGSDQELLKLSTASSRLS